MFSLIELRFLQVVCCGDRFWNPNLLDAGHHNLLRHVGDVEPCVPRRPPYRRHLPLRVHGPRRGVLLRQALQDNQGEGVEGRVPGWLDVEDFK